jgi:hypothetical protein
MAVQPRRDVDVAHPLRGVEHDPGALDLTPRRGHLAGAPLELGALVAIKLDHEATGPGHDDFFDATPPAPLHNSTDFRMRPLVGLR